MDHALGAASDPTGRAAASRVLRRRRRSPASHRGSRRIAPAPARRARERPARRPLPSTSAPAVDHAAALWQLCCRIGRTTTVAWQRVGSYARGHNPAIRQRLWIRTRSSVRRLTIQRLIGAAFGGRDADGPWRDWHWPRPGRHCQGRTLIRRGRGMSSPCAMPRWPRLARAFDVDRPLYRGRVELSRRNRERRPPQSPHIGAQQAKDGLEQTSGSEMAAHRRWWWREVVRRHSPAEPSARDVDLPSCRLTLQRHSRCTRLESTLRFTTAMTMSFLFGIS